MAPFADRLETLLEALPGRAALAARRFPARGGALPVARQMNDTHNDHQADESEGHAPPIVAPDDTVSLHGSELFPAGSLATLPVAVELMRRVDLRQFSLDDPHELPDGIFTLDETCQKMLGSAYADATSLLIDLVGMGEINETMSRMGLTATKLARTLLGSSYHREHQTSADDMVTLLSLMRAGALPGAKLLREMLPERHDDTGAVARVRVQGLGLSGHSGSALSVGAILTGAGGSAVVCALSELPLEVAAAADWTEECLAFIAARWCAKGT